LVDVSGNIQSFKWQKETIRQKLVYQLTVLRTWPIWDFILKTLSLRQEEIFMELEDKMFSAITK